MENIYKIIIFMGSWIYLICAVHIMVNIFLLSAVSATQVPTQANQPRTINVCNLDQTAPMPCLHIDPCSDEYAPLRGLWLLRKNQKLLIPNSSEIILENSGQVPQVPDTDNEKNFKHVNQYNIHTVTIPVGTKVQMCEPNFANYHSLLSNHLNSTYVHAHCKEPTSSLTTKNCYIQGQSGQSSNNIEDNLHLIENPEAQTCTITPSSTRFQIINFDLLPNWGCFQGADITALQTLYPDFNTPNTIIDILQCDLPEIRFEVSPGMFRCVHACRVVDDTLHPENQVHDTCQPQQYASQHSETCALLPAHQQKYLCHNCSTLDGHQVDPWLERYQLADQLANYNHFTCSHTPCTAGHYSMNSHTCNPCPLHHIAPPQASQCTQCELGLTSNQIQDQCEPCFLHDMSVEQTAKSASCPPGDIPNRNHTQTLQFFTTLHTNHPTILPLAQKTSILHHWCQENFACLPCAPGSFKQTPQDHTCTLCPFGKYQPNYGYTHCYACHSTQSTLTLGSHDGKQCLCIAGYEKDEEDKEDEEYAEEYALRTNHTTQTTQTIHNTSVP